eukprot:GEMP01040977.1.p1 GENE.GEMP01040977.1~~GEMP01040977.1.p1  ORF type:complete len:455 (+),score=87.00 GEMP01040977.1:128-1492(+)
MSISDEFEYESDDFMEGSECDEEAIQMENMFYEADDNKQNFPDLALEQFEKVVALEASKGSGVIWRFKALQNIVILSSRTGRFQQMAERYRELLKYMDQVTRNEASDAINTVLDSVSSASDLEKLETIYELTLEALQQTMNQRLWFSTSVKLAKLYLEKEDVAKLQNVVCSLHQSCMKPDGTDDDEKASQLVEVYALEIQLCTLTKNTARMKQIYPKTINLTSAIADPRNIAVIRERGGKMFMGEKKWHLAYNEFFEAFKNYQETGNSRAKVMLKYVVVANVLALSSINPFDSREAKVYADDPEISAVARLRSAYENNDVRTIDDLLSNPQYNISSDAFIASNLQELQRTIRLQILENLIKPYRTVKLDFLASELNVDGQEVVSLLVQLILDDKIKARIDETAGFLVLPTLDSECSKLERYTHLPQWLSALERIHGNVLCKLSLCKLSSYGLNF